MAETPNNPRDNLIWVDLEMTGLDPDKDVIIEIATIVTDAQLEIIAEGPVIAVAAEQSHLDNMDEWNTTHHGESGLLARVQASTTSAEEAARQTIAFLQAHVPAGASPMCGNSICQDRRFMVRGMPALEAWFHYRNVDVSTIKELVRRWNPAVLDGFSKRATHRALDDIRESIEELRFYRQHVFTM